MSDIQIFAFSGKMGSGKDFLASVLRSFLPQQRRCLFIALADHFKIEAMALDNMSYDRIYVRKDTESRRALQLRGTEQGRNIHGEDVWVRHLLAWMRAHLERGIDTFFITDVRFENELNLLRGLSESEEFHKALVKVFRVIAPERTRSRLMAESNGEPEAYDRIANHPSETALDELPASAFDLIIHNDPGQRGIEALRDYAVASRRIERHIVFLDLDDTLCECAIHYIECKNRAQLTVVEFLQDYLDGEVHPETFDQSFDEHRRNYETEEFCRDIFAEALVRAAIFCLTKHGLQDHPSAEHLFDLVHTIGMDVFNYAFAAIPEAVKTALWLNSLSSLKVVVVTVGERPDQLRKLWNLGLGQLECQCTLLKSPQAYRNWMQMYPAERYTMVGDSFVRDIKPALEAGIDCAIQVGRNVTRSDMTNHLVAASLAEALPMIMV